MDNSTVLIIGITGFLGRHMAKYLQNKYKDIKIIALQTPNIKYHNLQK